MNVVITEPSISEDARSPEIRAITIIVIALLVQAVAIILLIVASEEWVHVALVGLLLVGWVVTTFGCCDYARARGFPYFLGLVGSFGFIGVCVVLCLPKREPRHMRRQVRGFEVILKPPSMTRPD